MHGLIKSKELSRLSVSSVYVLLVPCCIWGRRIALSCTAPPWNLASQCIWGGTCIAWDTSHIYSSEWGGEKQATYMLLSKAENLSWVLVLYVKRNACKIWQLRLPMCLSFDIVCAFLLQAINSYNLPHCPISKGRFVTIPLWRCLPILAISTHYHVSVRIVWQLQQRNSNSEELWICQL